MLNVSNSLKNQLLGSNHLETMGDYFSTQSGIYAKSRPRYPEALISFLVSLCRHQKLAWDCGTGNGQTAAALSPYFETVIATDLSRNQLNQAEIKPNITYLEETAEEPSLAPGSADLITVATALHWFDVAKFFKAADRVLKPEGILAVWSYAGCSINPEIDTLFNEFAFGLLKDYWPPESKMIFEDRYENLQFPYPLLPAPAFKIEARYSLSDFTGYLQSWSATQLYLSKNGKDPVNRIMPELKQYWGDPAEKKTVTWEIVLKCGRKPDPDS